MKTVKILVGDTGCNIPAANDTAVTVKGKMAPQAQKAQCFL
jgi:hypothetical protein